LLSIGARGEDRCCRHAHAQEDENGLHSAHYQRRTLGPIPLLNSLLDAPCCWASPRSRFATTHPESGLVSQSRRLRPPFSERRPDTPERVICLNDVETPSIRPRPTPAPLLSVRYSGLTARTGAFPVLRRLVSSMRPPRCTTRDPEELFRISPQERNSQHQHTLCSASLVTAAPISWRRGGAFARRL
jgi:hypothetical protein